MSNSRSANDLQAYEIPVSDNYILNGKKKLGSGTFGEIYYGTQQGEDKEVAIKLE